MILTTVVVFSLTLYTFIAARRGHDFNFLGPFLFGALLVLLVFALIQVFWCEIFMFGVFFHAPHKFFVYLPFILKWALLPQKSISYQKIYSRMREWEGGVQKFYKGTERRSLQVLFLICMHVSTIGLIGPLMAKGFLYSVFFLSLQILFPLGRLSLMIYGCLASLIFCGYIIYDTDNLIKRFNYDQYIWASVSLYLDVINLFLSLLTVFRAAAN